MQNEIRQDKIVGSRRFSNYFWSVFLFIGGLGFFLAGISSYFKINLLPLTNTTELVFIPQGLVMIFYGTLSLSISFYIIITVFLPFYPCCEHSSYFTSLFSPYRLCSIS